MAFKYNNEKWKSPTEDLITIKTFENKRIKYIYAEAPGRGYNSGAGYLWNYTWDKAILEDVIDELPQLWVYELRTKGVQI